MPRAEVIEENEFREIMNDFTSPLEIVREAIQNSVDANAHEIKIDISLSDTGTGQFLDLVFQDDGDGIPIESFACFFNLGDSSKRNDNSKIGEKGHGTKIFYNSNSVKLESWVNHRKFVSILNEPYRKIFEGNELDYSTPTETPNEENVTHGTRVTISGYLKNTSADPAALFSHPAVKDYIQWFTVFASIETQFSTYRARGIQLLLKTYDSHLQNLQASFRYSLNENGYEEIEFGHPFPDHECSTKTELKRMGERLGQREWQDLYGKKLYCQEQVLEGIATPLQIVIWAEGDKLKRVYNPLIRERFTTNTKAFEYKVSDRYGFWACKNYIPIQRIDSWITGKGIYTKFHAFVNFDLFSLTANRSSVENTRPEHIRKIRNKLDQVFDEVTKNESFKNWIDLENTAAQERSAEEEKKEFKLRLANCKKRRKLIIDGTQYFEPRVEGEVALLFSGLLRAFPDDFRFEIMDYSTHKGIDYLIRQNPDIPLDNDSTIGFMELKYNLERGRFNHSFENLRYIVCQNIRGLRSGEEVTDLEDKKLRAIKNPDGWVLADYEGTVGHSIKILVIDEFLRSKGLEFC